MSDELQPCPLCGGAPLHERRWEAEDCGCVGTDHRVRCLNCRYTSPWGARSVVARWNTRPVENELRAEVERLRGLNEALPECWHCKRKATVRLVNRPTVLCDECSTDLGDDSVGTWRREELPWATAVRAALEETKR